MFFKKKDENNTDIEQILSRVNIPVLTLDKNWHKLFVDKDKNDDIKFYENQVNDLLKERGKLTNDLKRKKQLKKTLMDQILKLSTIVNNTGDVMAKAKMDENSDRIKTINEEIEEMNLRLDDIPSEIKYHNKQLFIKSLDVCYGDMDFKKNRISELDRWIIKTRQELKERIIEKQELESNVDNIYSLVHNIAGVGILDDIDKIYGE